MFVVAIGTHDRKSMHSDHVGDSEYFAVYEVGPDGYRLLEYRSNTSPEERMHGDPNKAKAIMEIVKGCDVLVGRAMGPNFVRIRDNSPYLPVIVRNRETVEEAVGTLAENYERLDSLVAARKDGTWDKKPVIFE